MNINEFLKPVDNLFTSEQAIFLFPAGLVSRKINGKITDLEWNKTFVSRAVTYQKPVVPIYIDGHLSNFFYRLSKLRSFIGVKANIEMFYLVDEMFNQQDRTIAITIGQPIEHTFFNSNVSHVQWAQWVKEEVYKLK